MNLSLILPMCFILNSAGQNPDIPLWKPGEVPFAQGMESADVPEIRVWLARGAKTPATSVLVVPGGGYGGLANDHEGKQIAEFLNSKGINAFVLKYRLGPKYKHPVPWTDASRAMRLIRDRADEWGVDSKRLGIWGFSAGGHLASTVATRFDTGLENPRDPIDKQSSRPDFAILCYPVISMEPPLTHGGSRRNLLGPNPDPDLARSLSNQNQVTTKTPPVFLFHTAADTVVVPQNSLIFYEACLKHKVPVELHLFQDGPHGVGLAQKDPQLKVWPSLLMNWLAKNKLVDPPAK